MDRRAAVRRPHLLAGALALLVALPLATWQGAAHATGPEDTTTTLELTSANPAYGDLVTVIAPVETDPGGVLVSNGEVTFDAAPTQGDLWGGGQHVSFGPIVVDGGIAYLEIDTSTLPFLDAQSDGFWVAAEYSPVEGNISYAGDYNQSAAVPLFIDLTTAPPGPFGTSTSVSAPASARVGTPVTLDATVVPAYVPGTVRFTVDGSPVGVPVPVSDGAASISHSFTTGGPHAVGAVFTPSDGASFAGSTAGPTTVTVVQPTSTQVTGPDAARAQTPTTLTATVSPAAAVGTVSFSVDGSPVGAPVSVVGGAASLAHTFTTAGEAMVRATFTPTDPTAYDASSDSAGLTVTVGKVETSVAIAGPDRVTAGAPTEITATVTPVGVPGRVAFLVDGRTVKRVPVTDGQAVLSHAFVSLRTSQVVAVWRPTDSATYERSSSAEHSVGVVAGSTAAEYAAFLAAAGASLFAPLDCSADGGRARADAVYHLLFTMTGMLFDLLRPLFDALRVHFTAVLCPPAGSSGKARSVQGTLDCQLTATGLQCPFDLPAFSEVRITTSVPLPAKLAGQDVDVTSSLSRVDPATGELTELAGEQSTVHVPRRTALSAELAPVRPGVDSVGRGEPVAYRLAVRNRGVLTADRVRACVAVGRGVEISSARGAVVRAGRACWTLPSLEKGEGARRSLTLVAPGRKGTLDLTAVVRPRPAQADPVRLVVALPVR